MKNKFSNEVIVEFIKKNIALIISIALSYIIITTTGEHWPNLIHRWFGINPDWSATKYKFPILILAFMILPVIRWFKKQLEQ